MQKSKLTHLKWVKRAIGTSIFVFVALWLTPLSLINCALPAHSQLLAPSGNIFRGEWHDVNLNAKRYPLSCDYQWQGIDWESVTYKLHCDTPLTMIGTLRVTRDGEIQFSKAHIQGELSAADDWRPLMGILLPLYAPLDINIKRVELVQGRLKYLDASGKADHFCLFSPPKDKSAVCAYSIDMMTVQKTLTPESPINIIYSNPDLEHGVRLNANTFIGEQEYLTFAEIRGEPLAKYEVILGLFGKKLGENAYLMQLMGKF